MPLIWSEMIEMSDNEQSLIVMLSPLSVTLIRTAFYYLDWIHNYGLTSDDEIGETADEIHAATAKLMLEMSGNMLIGTMLPYAGSTVPTGTLRCDGESYLRTDYPELYAALVGTDLIEDADIFHTPDMRDRTVVSASDTLTPGSLFGEAEHTLTVAEMPEHNHLYIPPSFDIDLQSPGAPDILAASVGAATVTGMQGADQPHNNIQPSIAYWYCIISGR